MQKYFVIVWLWFMRIVCFFRGHRLTQEQRGHYLYTGCGRCRQLKNVERLRYTRRREQTFGDIERDMASNPPPGYSFVDCNWKKRKAKFVSTGGQLKFVHF